MSPVIRISDENYDRLKLLVDDPFGGETPNTVVGRLLDAVLKSGRTLTHNVRADAAPARYVQDPRSRSARRTQAYLGTKSDH